MNEQRALTETAGTDESSLPAPSTQPEMTALLRLAIVEKMPVEALEKLVALSERMSDRLAAQEFHRALSDFQQACPSITKTSKASISTSSGTKYSYQYAELDHIAKTINPLLSPHGLSYTWDMRMVDKILECTCTLRHVNGHSITASFSCPMETKAGMSEQQKYAAALSYARRQSLVQVLGLTTCDPDTDAGSTETITDKQVADLDGLILEVKANKVLFLKFLGVEQLEDILAADFARAVKGLEDKRRKA